MRKLQQRQRNDLSRAVTALDMDTTLIAVVEMSLSSWLVAGIVPGVERKPLKKLKPDESALLDLLNRWRREAERTGRRISRITVRIYTCTDMLTVAPMVRPPVPRNPGSRPCRRRRTTDVLDHGDSRRPSNAAASRSAH